MGWDLFCREEKGKLFLKNSEGFTFIIVEANLNLSIQTPGYKVSIRSQLYNLQKVKTGYVTGD